MANTRLIARMDIKGPNLIKGIHLEGLRVIGDPHVNASRYYHDGIDELIYMDSVASLYGRNHLADIVQATANNIFIPMTVGGGIRTIRDVYDLLRSGADKIAVNTAATLKPELITEFATKFGSQCVVLSIEAKKVAPNCWEAYRDNGREPTGLDVVKWAKQGQELGAGEILLTSIDREGTRKGFDIELVQAVSQAVTIPVIASGGMGTVAHLVDVVKSGRADAVAMADILHYNRASVIEIKSASKQAGIRVRWEQHG